MAHIGRLVWNRLKYMKNPETGRRQSRLNPRELWIVSEVPQLRIVPQELWNKVKDQQAKMARATRPDRKKSGFWNAQRPRSLLSGLLKCAACGASYTKSGVNRFACARARDRATCTNCMTVRGDQIEQAILDCSRLGSWNPRCSRNLRGSLLQRSIVFAQRHPRRGLRCAATLSVWTVR